MRPAALSALLLAGAAAAQPTPETVDADLLYGFLGIEDASALTIGGSPSTELLALLPPEAAVLGTLVQSFYINGDPIQQERVLGRTAASPEAAAADYTSRVPAGWRIPEPYEPVGRGFVSSRGDGRSAAQVDLCSEGASGHVASVEFGERPGGGSYVTASRWAASRWLGDPCSSPEERAARYPEGFPDDLSQQLPVLRAPQGVRLDETGGGGSGDYHVSSATLYSDAAIGDVAAHFGAQVEAAGWTERTGAVGDDLAVSFWTRDSDDGPLTLTFTAQPEDAGEFSLRLVLLAQPR